MGIHLRVAQKNDIETIHQMQIQSFKVLLNKYQDIHTNPALETLKQVTEKYHRSNVIMYLIELDEIVIGAICLSKINVNHMRISPMFLLPDFQKRGHAKAAVDLLEKQHPEVKLWELQTIKEEQNLMHFYQKMGYLLSGEERMIKSGMTLVLFHKLT